MNSSLARFKDARVIVDGEDQFLLVEFNDGKIRQFTAKEIYEATGYLGKPPTIEQISGSERRAAEIMNLKRRR
jgi:hypothetical protein